MPSLWQHHAASAATSKLGRPGPLAFRDSRFISRLRAEDPWLLSHGALTSPFCQGLIFDRVRLWKLKRDRLLGNMWDAVTLPFALWKNC
ncbi:MAG TPA: hypothetical protein VH351_22715 [Bryobacteraceae bacterium]|jgi:hypothetical protein|nr:hypothetical protein [Bryobacteraceae bacterium]